MPFPFHNKTYVIFDGIQLAKGGLILESLSLWLKSPKKEVPNHYFKHYPHKRKDAADSDLAHFWVDLSQSEKKI